MLLKLCDNCGCQVSKGTLSIHGIRFYCQVYNMETEPYFKDRLINQGYDNMLYEYEYVLEYILPNKQMSLKVNITYLYSFCLIGWLNLIL